jgi:hypothetical protein
VLNGELEARERMFEEREEEVLLREAAVREEEERITTAKELLEEKIRNMEEKPTGTSFTGEDAMRLIFGQRWQEGPLTSR